MSPSAGPGMSAQGHAPVPMPGHGMLVREAVLS
jgi:hypothetical protein